MPRQGTRPPSQSAAPSAGPSQPRSHSGFSHWTTEKTLFFLSLLLQARRNKLMNSTKMPGTEYNSETGRLEMSPENADKIITKFSAHGRRTVNSGLWISNDINFKKWLEIFQTDLPARRHICLPDDEDFFNKTDDDDEVGEGEEILDVFDVAGETPQSSQLPAIREEVPIPNLRSPARTTAARLLVLPRNPQGQQYAL